MNKTIWKPNVVVAAIIEEDGKLLMVEEHTSQGVLFNQPGGHLEFGESLLAAVVRETLEETAYTFEPQHLVGIYHWHASRSDTTYLRFVFSGRILSHHPEQPLDEGIIRAGWMTLKEIRTSQERHRSPYVLRSSEDYLAGQSFPLSVLTQL